MSLFARVLLVLVCPVFAQTPSPPKFPAKSAQTVYLTKPLPISVDTVGPNFKGHDIVSIVGELKRSPMGVPKSEFETTSHYDERIKTLLESRSRQYYFVLDEFAATAVYNADDKVMSIKVLANAVSTLFDNDIHMVNDPTGDSPYFSSGFAVRSILRSTGHYLATNSFGVKVNVARSTFDEYGVVIDKGDSLFADVKPCCDHIGTREALLALEMDVQTAKALKPFLRVALVCTLVNPTIYEGTGGSSPTISYPREIEIRQHYLLVHPDELWAYDRRSGYILGKFVPGG